eukprot:156073_1
MQTNKARVIAFVANIILIIIHGARDNDTNFQAQIESLPTTIIAALIPLTGFLGFIAILFLKSCVNFDRIPFQCVFWFLHDAMFLFVAVCLLIFYTCSDIDCLECFSHFLLIAGHRTNAFVVP